MTVEELLIEMLEVHKVFDTIEVEMLRGLIAETRRLLDEIAEKAKEKGDYHTEFKARIAAGLFNTTLRIALYNCLARRCVKCG